MQEIVGILLDWHVLLIAACLLLIFPVVFFLSSLDKTPVKIRRVRMAVRRQTAPPAPERRPRPERSRLDADEGPEGQEPDSPPRPRAARTKDR